MDQIDATSDALFENKEIHHQPLRLFNDVYFSRAATPPSYDTWAPFSRLPVELRLHIWWLFLGRYRMINLGIHVAEGENATAYPGDTADGVRSRYYTNRNHLDKIVSGRGYTLVIRGRGYAASLNPLLWVNNEARQATLSFYRVHLPFPRQDGEQVLYLNPEYDVFCVRPEFRPKTLPPSPELRPQPPPRTLLADFLHDIKAYDPKNQGVEHLALHRDCIDNLKYYESGTIRPLRPFTPAMLHPVAAASFADILGNRLRSVLCVMGFRSHLRGMTDLPVEQGGCCSHFAQTFPLHRRGFPIGGFDWLTTDPRPGVQFDLQHVPFSEDPRRYAEGWKTLEKMFGVAERAEDDGFRFYICPAMAWHGWNGRAGQAGTEGEREELAFHLRVEKESWLEGRIYLYVSGVLGPDADSRIPRHGMLVDAETFEKMESAPSTAIGMWLFPAEAFKKPIDSRQSWFDVSAVLPGLFLFEV